MTPFLRTDKRALAVKPSPYYKPLNPLDEVPQRLGCAITPPVYHHSGNPGDNVRTEIFFERKVFQALECPAASDNKKR